jgi:hypothetical protein
LEPVHAILQFTSVTRLDARLHPFRLMFFS